MSDSIDQKNEGGPINFSRRSLLAAASSAAALGGPTLSLSSIPKTVEFRLRAAIRAGKARAIKRLQDWIALPSIAAENLNYPAGADMMAQLAREVGFQHVETLPTKGKPGVFATLDAGAPKTLGVYFMYDVKQFVPSEWTSPPLEGRIIDRPGVGKVMIGRGAENQKGPEAEFLAAILAFKDAGIKLPVNLVLIAEGEEEVASPHFPELIQTPAVLAALRNSVGVVVPGAEQGANGTIALSLGAKGALEFELIVDGAKWGRGPSQDVHSSEKARVDSPAWHLVEALSCLVSPDGNKIMIEGVPEMVVPLTARQRDLIALAAKKSDEQAVKKTLGVEKWINDMTWEESLIHISQDPTLNIQGLVAGYTGPGGKTILPHHAVAKMEMRLVPNMTKDDTVAKLRAHLDKHGFQDVIVNATGGYDPTTTDEEAVIIKASKAVYSHAGVEVSIIPRQQGSWPGSNFTGPPLSKPVVSFGLGHGGLEHSPDEFLIIESNNPKVVGFEGAIYGYVDFFYEIAALD